jgi:cobalt-zinc-cadmium efflux system outer membrane protein
MCGVLACLFAFKSRALSPLSGDEIDISFSQGKDLLLKENLQVLSNHYNIDLAEANLITARLWANPYFVWNADMYSVEQNRYFNFKNQKLIQIEYVFSVSGKRVNAIREANLQLDMASLAFSDVVRGLIREYSDSYSNYSTLKSKEKTYALVLSKFETLINLYQKQLETGLISQSDLIRLKAELISIQSEAIQNQNEMISELGNLCTLLNLKPGTKINPSYLVASTKDSLKMEDYIITAKTNRPDLLLANKDIKFAEQVLRSEKSSAIPDMKLGYQPHDKGSNYVRPYSGMVWEMGIPIFNRNQGNITKARIEIEQSKIDYQYIDLLVENEVVNAYLIFLNNKNNLEKYSGMLLNQMEDLAKSAAENFEKKNISLLQYIDYQRSYIDLQMQYNDILNVYRLSVNQLNFVIGKELIY